MNEWIEYTSVLEERVLYSNSQFIAVLLSKQGTFKNDDKWSLDDRWSLRAGKWQSRDVNLGPTLQLHC